jgi:hypothetical protein
MPMPGGSGSSSSSSVALDDAEAVLQVNALAGKALLQLLQQQ